MDLHLDRYQELMKLPINAFNGINKPSERNDYHCNTIWRKQNRLDLANYLHMAQEAREKELGFSLQPTYFTQQENDVRNPHKLLHCKLIKLGLQTVEAAVNVSLELSTGGVINDPVQITETVDFTDVSEVVFYKPGTTTIVNPSYINIASTTLTAKFPRAHLVDPDMDLDALSNDVNDADQGLDYYDDDNFVDSLDMVRIWYDPAQAASYQWYNIWSFDLQTQEAYARIVDTRLSIVRVDPATWSGSVPSVKYWMSPFPSSTLTVINYVAGAELSTAMDMRTIRLA